MKKLHIRLFVTLLTTLLLTACQDETNSKGEGSISNVKVNFKALWNGKPLVMNEKVSLGEQTMNISRLRFFISDLSLKQDKKEITLDEVDVVDFTESNKDAAGAANGVFVSTKSAVTGTYDGCAFGLGVASDFNTLEPSHFASGHPLSNAGDYWRSWNSFIFSKIEGRFDGDSDPNTLDGAYVIHLGKDKLYKEIIFSDLNITVTKGKEITIIIPLEVSKLFKEADGTDVDISKVGKIHGNQKDSMYETLFANNWQKAFSIKY